MARPAIIDLYPAEVEPDGTRVFRPPFEAVAVQATQGLAWLLMEYPHQTTHSLALATIGAACALLARAAVQQDSAQKRSRRK